MAAYVTLIANLSPFLMLVIINYLTFKLLKKRANRVSQTPRRKRRHHQAVLSLIIIVISFIFCHGFEIVINIVEIHNILTGDIKYWWVWCGVNNTTVFQVKYGQDTTQVLVLLPKLSKLLAHSTSSSISLRNIVTLLFRLKFFFKISDFFCILCMYFL